MKVKLISIAGVLLLLVMALMQISDIVHDREKYRDTAVKSVVSSLAGNQTLTGPLIHVACTEEWDVVTGKTLEPTDPANADKPVVPVAAPVRTERKEHIFVAAPTALSINGGTQLEKRSRSLYATQVFNLKAQVTAQWADTKVLKPTPDHANSRMNCGQPLLMMSVSDARGIRHVSVKVGGQPLALKAGTFFGSLPRGVHASLPSALLNAPSLEAQFDLELVGTDKIAIVPLGDDTQAVITSNWAHPSFKGQFLPVEKNITKDGFTASWRVSSLASTAQQEVANSPKVKIICADEAPPSEGETHADGCVETFNVIFVDPSNTYALSDRATKYGLLFVGLTFLAVGMFELMKSLRVHPIQYLLVGAAISMFFLLLVSLSEHMDFALAYAVAAASCVLLLTYYASDMLKSWARGLPFGLGIGLLYGMLFVLLIEQTALLVGAVGLFAVLAAIMMLTSKVDWYARLRQMSAALPANGPKPGPSYASPASTASSSVPAQAKPQSQVPVGDDWPA